MKLILPCKHEEKVTRQVQPTIDLLTNMDEWHPDVLLQHDIQPADYKSGLVFRSAIESIRGTFIASSKPGREGLIKDVLENLLHTLDTLGLPGLILELFGVDATAQDEHIWAVRVKVVELATGRLRREVQVWRQGKVVGESISRSWRPEG